MAYIGRPPSNATLSSGDIEDNIVTLAKLSGGTDGNIISYDASGDPVAITTGSDGQVLTSTGAGSPPAFEAVTALGTVTAGDISHADIVYPAGHVLQVLHFEDSEINVLTTTYVNLYEKSITLKSASSDIFGFLTLQYGVTSGGDFGFKIYRNTSATVTTSHTAVWTKNQAGGSDNPYTIGNSAGGTTRGVSTMQFKDVLSGLSVDDDLYYGAFFRVAGGTVAVPGGDSENGFFSLQLMEVQK